MTCIVKLFGYCTGQSVYLVNGNTEYG